MSRPGPQKSKKRFQDQDGVLPPSSMAALLLVLPPASAASSSLLPPLPIVPDAFSLRGFTSTWADNEACGTW
jgi:hypothetical protein